MKKLLALLMIAMFAASACSSADAQKMADKTNEKVKEEANEEVEEQKAEGEAAANAAAEEATTVDVAETLVKTGNHTTLRAAVDAAGLTQTLKGAGPFTVFAPTDDAFKALPAGTVEELLKPENKEKLAGILTYHVVPAKVMAADVATMEADTVNGAKASVVVAEDGAVTYAGATVTETDLNATNGVVHVIDAVVMPPEGDATAAK
jgi:uncharacterized surface protein with fasciclin (FAS1) repeats